ncbi:hypothetical protein ABBQ32_006325 [Trebouxia sp. C0010 RCD-2024]
MVVAQHPPEAAPASPDMQAGLVLHLTINTMLRPPDALDNYFMAKRLSTTAPGYETLLHGEAGLQGPGGELSTTSKAGTRWAVLQDLQAITYPSDQHRVDDYRQIMRLSTAYSCLLVAAHSTLQPPSQP